MEIKKVEYRGIGHRVYIERESTLFAAYILEEQAFAETVGFEGKRITPDAILKEVANFAWTNQDHILRSGSYEIDYDDVKTKEGQVKWAKLRE